MSSFLTISTRSGHQVSFSIYASILFLKPVCRAVTFQAGIWIHINHRRNNKLARQIIFSVEVVIVVVITPSLKIGSIIHALGKSISIFVPWLPLVSNLALTIIVIISFIIIKLSTTIIASSTVIVIILSLVIRL